jgi:dipeptidase
VCDTIVALPASTLDQVTLFGKNSDRQRNEAQPVEIFSAADHAEHAQLECTHITIPQVRHTHAVLLCRPFWIWGAEMGVNEHGVAIGNEAVFARTAPSREPRLIGMDLLRLGLERATTAGEAVQQIVELLERYGQGGNCGHFSPSYYHNSFMIADVNEGYVLETLEREWLIERAPSVRSISNAYSIDRADRVSPGLHALIRSSGWSTEEPPRYSAALADPEKQHIGSAYGRRACSTALLQLREGNIVLADMMRILRDHGTGDGFHPQWRIEERLNRTLCLHAGTEDLMGQTVGSLVAQLQKKDAVHWVTGTAAPCLSIFKPVLLDLPLPEHGPRSTDRFDPRTLWWRHERLHRAAMQGDLGKVLEVIGPERDALEAEFRARMDAVLDGGTPAERSRMIAACWHEAMEVQERWYAQLAGASASEDSDWSRTWRRFNEIAGMDGTNGVTG